MDQLTVRIDAHHHLWDPARATYPWLTDDLGAINRAFTVDDLAACLIDAAIDHSVVVQTRSSVEETRELLAIASASELIAGVVGWVDLTAADVADRLDELRRSGAGRLVGIRHQVHDESDETWLDRTDVRSGVAAVGHAGLAFDLLVRTRELPAATRLARSLPTVRFVLDHAAKPPLTEADRSAWEAGVRSLARQPNVSCKLSGLVTEADWPTWTVDDLRPAADVVLDAFGPDRVLFGSDWPVCLLAGAYDRVVAAAEALTAELDDREREAVWGGNAAAIYQLEVSPR